MMLKLKEWRKYLKFRSRTAFAKELGIDQSTYDRMEKSADGEIKVKYLFAISKMAEVPIDALSLDPIEYLKNKNNQVQTLEEELTERNKDVVSLNNEFRKYKELMDVRLNTLEAELMRNKH